MIPKSTAKLMSGDYCWISRTDGKLVPFVYICKKGKSRSYFHGGIAECVLDPGGVDFPSNIEIKEYAMLHIKCFKENDTPIVGNLEEHLSGGLLKSLSSKVNETGIGSKTRVWGHNTIYKYANAVKP